MPSYPAEQIPVTVAQILHAVGHNAFARGERYYRAGQVLQAHYDAAELTFTSRVAGGSTRPYSQSVVFPRTRVPHAAPFQSFCSCPVRTGCKHVVAALLGWFHEGGWAEPAENLPVRSTAGTETEHFAATGSAAARSSATDAGSAPGLPGPDASGSASARRDSQAGSGAEDRAATIQRLRAAIGGIDGGTGAPAASPAVSPAPASASSSNGGAPGAARGGDDVVETQDPGAGPFAARADAPQVRDSWRRHVARALQSQSMDLRSRVTRSPGALDLHLEVPTRYGLGRGDAATPAPIRLSARPLMLGTRGRWIKGGLTWSQFTGPPGGTQLLSEHEAWFRELGAVLSPDQNPYASTHDTMQLDPVASPLLWDLLDRAADLGIAIVVDGRAVSVGLAPEARLGLHVADAEDGALRLIPALLVPRSPEEAEDDAAPEAWRVPTDGLFPLGPAHRPQAYVALGGALHRAYEQEARRSGAWSAIRPSPLPQLAAQVPQEQWVAEETELLFLPLAAPPTPLATSLSASGPMTVPREEVLDFAEGFYPQLARRLPVAADPEVAESLPQVLEPRLVLSVRFEEDPHAQPTPEQGAARTADPRASERIAPAQYDWHWSYPQAPVQWEGQEVARTRVPVAVASPDPHRELRDAETEQDVLTRLRRALPETPLEAGRTSGWQTRDLVQRIIPAARDLDGVDVELTGEVPQFRALDEDPTITVSVESTGDRDWFGLGVTIRAGQWYVPFADVFRALDAGQKHLMLGDGSYFRLDRPEFLRLRELIGEARQMADPETPLRISRHQAGLWEDLEELAADTEVTRTWRESVEALLRLEEIPAPPLPRGLRARLRPYQEEGYRWLSFLREHGLGGILADDMGLGKTVQTLAMICRAFELHDAAAAEGGARPRFLVVAPTSVAPNWAREIERFAPHLSCAVLTSSSTKAKSSVPERAAGADVVVTSYALLRLDAEEYADLGLSGLVLDEAQFLKNPRTKAHRIARDLPVPFKLVVTGTPMENDLMELWAMFSIVAPGLFPSARDFRDMYAKPISSGEDPQALPRLRRRIRPLMLRRSKELVAADLPEKQEHRVDIALTPEHRRIYETRLQRERQKILGLLQDMDRNRLTIFQSLTMLRRLALSASLVDEAHVGVESAKLTWLTEQLPEIIADGHRALVFSQFTTFLHQIAEALEAAGIEHVYLDGSTRDRAAVLRAFEAGEAPVFLISLKAGGFGLNLTEADYCFLMDPWWNPAAEAQAVDRAHRIGQRRRVMVYRLVSEGTIEEKVMDLKESKAALFDAVMDDGELFSRSLRAEEIRELLGG